MKRILPLLVFVTTMPGCVVWEIRDEMRNVHAQLNEVNAELGGVNTSLESVQIQLAMLEQTRDRLIQVEGGLGQTNTSLSSLAQQLQLLRSIQTSLGNLDAQAVAAKHPGHQPRGALPELRGRRDRADRRPRARAASRSPRPAPTRSTTMTPRRLVRPDPLLGVWMTSARRGSGR